MVVNFDRNQNLTTDQKLQSLLESVQLALNEIDTRFDEIDKAIKELEQGN